MDNTFRIFRKDAKHLWMEIVISCSLTVGFAATQPYLWHIVDMEDRSRLMQTLCAWFSGLMILSWALLVARSVHDESLVGDRQFWVTRPYGWQRVLLAKVIFLASFILVPYLLAQVWLLHKAELPVVTVLPGLLYMMVGVAGMVLLPLMTLATITSGIGRMVLTLLGLAVYMALAAYFINLFVNQDAWEPHTGDPFVWSIFVGLLVCALVVGLQYAQRRTALSIYFLLGLVAFYTFVAVLETKRIPLTQTPYPALGAGEPPPAIFTLNAPYLAEPLPDMPSRKEGPVGQITLPFTISGIAPGHMLEIVGRKFSVQNTSGTYEQSWENQGSGKVFNGDEVQEVLDVYPKGLRGIDKNLPSIVHATYALDEFEPVAATVVHVAQTVDLPDHGHCVTVGEEETLRHEESFACVYALHSPLRVRFQYMLHAVCGVSSPGDRSIESWATDPFEGDWFAVTAVSPIYADLPRVRVASNGTILRVCDGDPITVTRYRYARQRLMQVTTPPIQPSLYVKVNPDLRIHFAQTGRWD